LGFVNVYYDNELQHIIEMFVNTITQWQHELAALYMNIKRRIGVKNGVSTVQLM